MKLELRTEDEAGTRALGRRLGERLGPGVLVGIDGPLGAGKTVFVQGLARGLGVPESTRVSSPTYAYVNEYEARPGVRLLHLDLYRLSSIDDLEAIGYREMYDAEGAVCAVEWFSRVPEAHPAAWLEVRIEPEAEEDGARRVTVVAHQGHGQAALEHVAQGWGP